MPSKPEELSDDLSAGISEVREEIDSQEIIDKFERETEGQGLFYSLTHLNGHYFDD